MGKEIKPDRVSLLDLSKAEITEVFDKQGFEKYRGAQVFEWINERQKLRSDDQFASQPERDLAAALSLSVPFDR